MMRIALAALLLGAFLAWADGPDRSRRQARLGEVKARLALSEEQAAQVKPILEDHVEAQTAILDRYGINGAGRGSDRRPGYETLRALRKELEAHRTTTEARLSGVLSAEQLAEFRKIQAERKEQIQEEMRSGHVERIASRLGLAEAQMAQVKAILARHFDAQMAILDKHGIDVAGRDGRRRLGFRKRRALRRDLDGNMSETVAQLAGILSAPQLAEYEKIQAARREQLRKALRSD